jgi:hypothetical protein
MLETVLVRLVDGRIGWHRSCALDARSGAL